MARLRGGYQGAKSCTSGPQPGAWGQMDWYLHNYKDLGGVNSGIYNCRAVRGGRTTSLHGEGRASDNGVRPYSAEYGTKLANAIVNNSRALGVQCVIWNRKIWSSTYPDQWRNYTGVASHVDHLHVEFTWASAKRARAEQAELWAKILGGGAGGGTSPSGSEKPYTTVTYGQLLKLYTKGNPVKDVQHVLGLKVDSYYGRDTANAVGKFQEKHGLAVDKIVGPKTWNKIKAQPNFKSHKPATKGKTKGSVPGPGHAFPLPERYYFGPRSGGNRSVSGFYNRKFRGKTDRYWLREFATQLARRGWSVGKGKTWLRSAGNDGKYGSEYAALIRAFQKDQGLAVDELLGKKTWDAAFRNPIT